MTNSHDPGAGDRSLPSTMQQDDPEIEVLRRLGMRWSTRPSTNDLHGIHPDLTVGTLEAAAVTASTVVKEAHGRQGLRPVQPGVLEATSDVRRARGRAGNVLVHIRGLFIGDPLSNAQAIHERLSKFKALAVLSSDALSSVAYATGAMMAVLILAAGQAFNYSLGIGIAIASLMAIVVFSYRQTIKAYPKGGGSYIVTRDHLGGIAGLVAGSSLMIDYVLTVAVSTSAGVAALVSLDSRLAPHTVSLTVACVVLLCIANLRGVRESGTIFALPTYLFVGGIYIMIVAGAFKFFSGGGHVAAYPAIHASESLTLFLVLRAFASGCTALTGIEAISDGIPAFKPPEWKNARTTLTAMGVLALGMFLGITLLVHAFGLVPNPGDNPPTLLSKLAAHVFGTGPVYIYIQITTALILSLAANTAYSDFPRLSFFMARDGFMPHQFGHRGDRLSYSNGIILLTIVAIVLIFAFNGSVDALINLYVIGVFNSFTLSQISMVKRWWTKREPGWRRNIVVNGVGAFATFLVLLVTASTKFVHGAWIVIVLVVVMIGIFWMIHHHYTRVKQALQPETPLSPDDIQNTVIVPVTDLNRVALQTLAYARSISDCVIAVHVSDDSEEQTRIRQKWNAWGDHVPLVIINSPYRSIVAPLLAYVDAIDQQSEADTLTVVLPEFVAAHWWQSLLHNQTALRLKTALLFRPGTIVTSVPYHLRR
ncbi:MAG: APC family permease [Chloroflexota bacterium]